MTLFLDDTREPWKKGYIGATWAKTAAEAIEILKTGNVTLASLDHDLSAEATMGLKVPDDETGYAVVCWLEAHPAFWPVQGVRVHSLNRAGTARMLPAIRAHYGRDFQREIPAPESTVGERGR